MVEEVIREGFPRENRTGVNTIADFAKYLRFDLERGFPICTHKRINFNNVKAELIWFLSGVRNTAWLNQHTKIWEPWANEQGELDYVYGRYWRNFPVHNEPFNIDQIRNISNMLENDSNSRRMVLSAWHPGDAVKPLKAPPACHTMAIFSTIGERLNCHLTMRSADLGVGVPYNIASYALLTSMLAHCHHWRPGILTITMVDCHIYHNHIEPLLTRFKNGKLYTLPELRLNPAKVDIDSFTMDDIELLGYESDEPLKLEVAV